jgi:creatinine amidohydrolase
MELGDMNWMEVQEYLKKENRIIVVLGATEQHGYLSVTTDVSIPLALAESASAQSGVSSHLP